MKLILFRCLLALLPFTFLNASAQSYPDALSNGNLNIDGQTVPVKIFTTTSGRDLSQFGNKKIDENILIILNEDLNKYAAALYPEFINKGYEVLDVKFQPTNDFTHFKYLFKPKESINKITEGSQVKLSTQFFIWDVHKGLKIGKFTLHYYSLMFVFAFLFGLLIMSRIYKAENVKIDYLEPLVTWTIVGTILGARLGHVIFYQPELFQEDFWSVFLPIRTKPNFEFTGFTGLASHGAAIALIITTVYYSYKILKRNPFWVFDRLAITVALAGLFIRMGNFFNSEIVGKITSEDSPFAVLFPQMSNEYGISVPRYPSQLFEGIAYFALFVVLMLIYKFTNKKYQQGWMFGFFLSILFLIRFLVEFIKEPQGEELIRWGNLNTGQVLSVPFILAGIIIMLISTKFRFEKSTSMPK